MRLSFYCAATVSALMAHNYTVNAVRIESKSSLAVDAIDVQEESSDPFFCQTDSDDEENILSQIRAKAVSDDQLEKKPGQHNSGARTEGQIKRDNDDVIYKGLVEQNDNLKSNVQGIEAYTEDVKQRQAEIQQ